MTTFDRREEAFEQQFAHDEELKFKATARRNKMLGLWAAAKARPFRRRSRQLRALGGDVSTSRTPAITTWRTRSARISTPKASRSPITRSSRTMTELMAKAVADIKAGR